MRHTPFIRTGKASDTYVQSYLVIGMTDIQLLSSAHVHFSFVRHSETEGKEGRETNEWNEMNGMNEGVHKPNSLHKLPFIFSSLSSLLLLLLLRLLLLHVAEASFHHTRSSFHRFASPLPLPYIPTLAGFSASHLVL